MDSILRGLESGTRLVDQLRAEKFRRPAAADVVARLAALSPIEYDQQRDAAARQLHCRVGTLDEEVRRVRARTAAEAEAPVVVQDDEPWPYEVNGADLLDCLRTFAQRFLVLPDRGADVIALWSLFTHCIESVSVAPILAITSPTKRCGKTAVIDLLKLLCRRGLAASSITAAALFRSVEKWAPTLLIDEADTFLRDHDELRGILNSGHTRSSAFVIRCAGDAYEPTRYTVSVRRTTP